MAMSLLRTKGYKFSSMIKRSESFTVKRESIDYAVKTNVTHSIAHCRHITKHHWMFFLLAKKKLILFPSVDLLMRKLMPLSTNVSSP